jgi:phosphopantothenoylcysteine decarboxylase/phosphopantothenate--cysteine ligase
LSLSEKKILFIISGGIAAYKCLDIIRKLREEGAHVRCVLTRGGSQFVTKLSLSALSEEQVYDDLFALDEDFGMSHIKLARQSDLVLIAPATADIMAKIAHGIAEDLATTLILACDKPIVIAPAMNSVMWYNQATQDNISLLKKRSFRFIDPEEGSLACGETGAGRMAESHVIINEIKKTFINTKSVIHQDLLGCHVIVTSGPTQESIDPVRFISNRSSGKQGHSIAQAFQERGARVSLITGPVSEPDPKNITVIHVETAEEMLEAVLHSLPAEIAVCAAAVADWKLSETFSQKYKKTKDKKPPEIKLVPNPDILHKISTLPKSRPILVAGFAAETENIIENAQKKLISKGCDIIYANDVSTNKGVIGSDHNQIYRIDSHMIDVWPMMTKQKTAQKISQDLSQILMERNKNSVKG